ncbi:hypothetical protein CPB84DRAFT_1773410 [Gymnopilus junonius]|uniref:Uncharacterized protein n=1 Tax=Gymnopilus junonius TaxID=109634 RepID=A0A9P5TP64_GYMJU|nr:hypothetical protein CPB84DRAFT_1773410 [Gymnopilus junonius]
MVIPLIELPFTFFKGNISGAEMLARHNFWDSPKTIQWFKGHGYTLYQRVESSTGAVPSFLLKNSRTPTIHTLTTM